MTKWTVYIQDEKDLKIYLKYPISKILIEEPRFSLRCERKYSLTTDFSYMEKMYEIAKSMNPDIKVLFNYDLLLHPSDFKYCDRFIHFLSKIPYTGIRVQDYGLALFISENYPEMELEISTFTGNYNYKAMDFFKENFPSMSCYVYPNDVDYKTLRFLEEKSKTKNELFFHGPLLLFYSRRRLIKESDYSDKLIGKNKYYEVYLKEKKRPKEFFRFIDNHHGSFLFYPKEISLIEYLSDFMSLNLSYGLIDLRGKEIDFIYRFNDAFFDIIKNDLYREEDRSLFQKKILEIQSLYNGNLTEGFFLKNKTDITKTNINNENKILLGKIISVVKDRVMAIRVINRFSKDQDNLVIQIPSSKKIKYYLKFIKDIEQNSIDQAIEEDIVLVNTVKGVVPQSLLYLYQE